MKTARKKFCLVLALAFCLALLSETGLFVPPVCPEAAEPAFSPERIDMAEPEGREGEFRLPERLAVIEREAFEGTAAVSVVLGAEIREVADRAFAGIETLRFVRSGDTGALKMEGNVFDGSSVPVTLGSAESGLREWAARKQLRFELLSAFGLRKWNRELSRLPGSGVLLSLRKESQRGTGTEEAKTPRQGRDVGELKMELGRQVSRGYIRSRYFP